MVAETTALKEEKNGAQKFDSQFILQAQPRKPLGVDDQFNDWPITGGGASCCIDWDVAYSTVDCAILLCIVRVARQVALRVLYLEEARMINQTYLRTSIKVMPRWAARALLVSRLARGSGANTARRR